jgi:hypothetical protein
MLMAAYQTVVAATTITAAWGNNVRDGIVCTGATPGGVITSPVAGQIFSQTSNDANEGLWHRNSASQWRLPWNLPWGVIGETTSTTNQTPVGGTSTFLSQAFTAVGNRKYLVEIGCTQIVTVGAGQNNIQIWDGGGALQKADMMLTPAASAAGTYGGRTLSVVWTPAAGAQTAQFRTFTNATSISVQCAAVAPAFIRVRDIGPAGVPA